MRKRTLSYIGGVVLVVGIIGVIWFSSNSNDHHSDSSSQNIMIHENGANSNSSGLTTHSSNTDHLATGVYPSVSSSPSVTRSGDLWVFRQPNVDWPTQVWTINGKNLTYVFGEGNPSEIAIPADKIDEYMETHDPETGEAPRGYVTPEVEQALKEFLSNPALPEFLNKCQRLLPINSSDNAFGEPFPTDFDMNTLLFVNPKTGLKELRYQDIIMMLSYFNTLDNPIASPEEKRWPQCLSNEEYHTIFIPLHEQLSNVYRTYSAY